MSAPITPGNIPGDIPGYIAAVGALGVAAFGAVEAIGKTVLVFNLPSGKKGERHAGGLPYAGFGKVKALLKLVGPALKVSLGDDYHTIIQNQYRAGRSSGQAPQTISQGVRLGLPFLSPSDAEAVIKAVWGMPDPNAHDFAAALTTEVAGTATPSTATPTPAQKQAMGMAGRFSTALDTRVQAAFEVAEEVYQAQAQFWAAVVAVGLSLGYQGMTTGWKPPATSDDWGHWAIALVVGLVAVPLAPAAKDLSSSLSDALTALGQLRVPGK